MLASQGATAGVGPAVTGLSQGSAAKRPIAPCHDRCSAFRD
jgi:hypothetical protein